MLGIVLEYTRITPISSEEEMSNPNVWTVHKLKSNYIEVPCWQMFKKLYYTDL